MPGILPIVRPIPSPSINAMMGFSGTVKVPLGLGRITLPCEGYSNFSNVIEVVRSPRGFERLLRIVA